MATIIYHFTFVIDGVDQYYHGGMKPVGISIPELNVFAHGQPTWHQKRIALPVVPVPERNRQNCPSIYKLKSG